MTSALTDEKLLAALHAWPLSKPLTIQRLPGGSTPTSNADNLAKARRELELWLARL